MPVIAIRTSARFRDSAFLFMILPPAAGASWANRAELHQPLRPGRDGRRDRREFLVRFLEGLAVVPGDPPVPPGLSGRCDRAHLHYFGSAIVTAKLTASALNGEGM